MGKMSVNTFQEEKVAAQRPTFERGKREHSRRGGFLDFLSRGGVKRLLFLACDATALALSNWLSLIGTQKLFAIPRENLSPHGYFIFCLPFALVVLSLAGGYQSPELRRPEKELAITFRAVSLTFLGLICANFVFFKELGFSRYLFVSWYFLAILAIPFFRLVVRGGYGALWRRGLAQQRAVWIGCPDKLAEFENLLSVQRFRGYRMVGAVPASDLEGWDPLGESRPTGLGVQSTWDETLEKLRVQLAVVCLPSTSPGSHTFVGKILQYGKARGIDVEVFSDLFATSEFNFEIDEFSGFIRFYAVPAWSQQIQKQVKLCLDRIAGFVGSLLTVLVAPVVGALIKLEDGGPIFYRSAYVGRDGENRYYLKFRTMRVDADHFLEQNPDLRKQFESKQKLKQDPRVTRVGRVLRKFSLDEFPSFFSILRGDISLVGPRTIRKREAERYASLLPKLLSVKPGLTGFWQVMGRQLTTYEERVKMDMFYIDHWSVWLDLLIIAKTFWKVIRAEGAY
jgi:exopolysaccharide biosynthesis polyprenyl glycosylphosphotransferase